MNLNEVHSLVQQQSEKDNLYPDFEIRDLECTRQDIILFQDINFRLNTGQILQIDGVNGSGKTSLHGITSPGNRKPLARHRRC